MSPRFLLFPVVLIVSLIAFIFWGKPFWDENKALNKEVVGLRNDLNEIKNKTSSAKKVANQYDDLGEGKALIENALPEDKEENVLLAEFFEKAKKSGVFLKNIKFEGAKPLEMSFLQIASASGSKKEKKPLDIISSDNVFDTVNKADEDNVYGLKVAKSSMELVGQYNEIRDFILEVEKMNRFLNVTKLSLKKNEINKSSNEETNTQNDQVANVEVALEMNIYWLKSRAEERKNLDSKQSAIKSFSNDSILKNLLEGKLSADVLNDFQNSITKEVFLFGQSGDFGGYGKTDLF